MVIEHLHSTQYLKLARSADANYWDIIAVVQCPVSEGTEPHCWVVCQREHLPAERAFLVTQGVMPEEGEAFFCHSNYDLSLPRAMTILSDKVARDVMALV